MSMSKRLVLVAGAAVIVAAGLYLLRHYFTAGPATDSASLSSAPATAKTAQALAPAQTARAVRPTNQPPTRELDSKVNPYAPSLHEPGRSKRAWDTDFLTNLQSAVKDGPIRFELTGGRMAAGTIKITQHRDGKLTYLSGELTEPEAGKFFFLTPPLGGKAGKAVGVIEFPASRTTYRIEPTGLNGGPELWERRLDEVICLNMVPPDARLTNNPVEIPPLRPDLSPSYVPVWNSNIISLQSYPGSSAVLLLDFFGGYTPTWGGITYSRPSVNNTQIKDLWKRVAEDFMPFNINVTTDIKVYQAAPANSRQRCCFTDTPVTGAGVAYIGSWNWGSDTPCWSVYNYDKNGAEVGAHEPGHTLNLGHQTQDFADGSHNEYFLGHGDGATGWAPTMGAGYYKNVTSWAKGEYESAGNTQDELNVIVSNNNNVDYRPDDTGATLATSRYLELYSGNTASAEGVIEQTSDTDAFRFTTSGGAVSLTASPVGDWASLAISATLADASDTVIASNNPQTVLTASISTTLSAGTYTFRVTGAGRNNPQANGFSSYGSLGYYSVTGTVAGARLPTRFYLSERATNGTAVGTVPASNTNANLLVYAIASGNTSNTFAINNSGALTVANSATLDYESLALKTMLQVQFELFVNITNTVDSAQTELNRRVVVVVTNVNEAPTLMGFNVTLLEHTKVGTVIGQVTGADLDFNTVLRYSIASGNSNSMFAIDANYGILSVAGDLNVTNRSAYTLGVVVSDQTGSTPLTATSTVSVVVLSNTTPFQPGTICYAIYENITDSTVASLTNAAVFPRDPTSEKQVTLFEGDTDRGDTYGAVIRGYVIPPASGSYTFWIASDDNGELWLSTSTNAASATLIASVSGSTGSREWTKYFSQQSTAVTLVAGRAYYIEARMKEGSGGDNLAVAWQCASAGLSRDVIPGRFLAPYFLNYLPHPSGFTAKLHKDAVTGSRLGTVTVTDLNASDNHTFLISGGNTDGIFSIDTNAGIMRVANDAALLATAKTSYSLTVRTIDTGSPALSNTTTVTVSIVATNAITATAPQQEVWNNIGSGNAVTDLTGNARYPKQPDALRSLTAFDGGQNIADSYGSRIRALLTPTSSGAFTFFIASDDYSQLKLSTNADPANATVIASLSGSVAYQNWAGYASQKSAAITLVAGQTYYIEALQKEGVGDDNLSVGWTGPGLATTNAIDDAFLTPVDLNYPPILTNKVRSVSLSASNGTLVTTMIATDSSLDTLAYKLVSGNTGGAFAINPDNGQITVADSSQVALSGGMPFSLGVQAQDSGYGGLYPLKSAQAVVTVQVTGSNRPPTVTLTSPTNDATLAAPVTMLATATDPDNNVSRVEFYDGATKLGLATNAPYTLVWSNAPLGGHNLLAVAVDAYDATATSAVARVYVVPSVNVTMISTGAVWKFLDNGSNPGTAWRNTNYNDAAWKSGPAQLGYGDGDEATVVSFGPNSTNKYITTYFRRSFVVADPSLVQTLNSRLLRDDGAIAYLNGVEFFRNNMPTNAVNYLTPASTGAGDDGTIFFLTNLDLALLIAGTNVVAVEVHQNTNTSSDLSFDFELSATVLAPPPNQPPSVVLTNPASGTRFAAPAAFTLMADAQDTDGVVTKVEFFSSDTKLAESTNAPYQITLTDLPIGGYVFAARATDNKGATTTSDSIWVQVLESGTTTVVPIGSVWKYLDNGANLGTAWRNTNYNDSAWKSGPAQLGYGDGDEATVVGYGPNATNKYITTYFRRSFAINDPSLVISLTSRVLRDDGAIAYLNGVEFFRNNMPAGNVTYLTPASTACADDGTIFFPTNVNPALLMPGTNVLAVEIHQSTNTSSDITFDLEFTAHVLVVPPAVLDIALSSGAPALSWPAAAGNFLLYTTTNMTPPVTWLPATNEAFILNGQWTIPLTGPTNGGRFYRLQSP